MHPCSEAIKKLWNPKRLCMEEWHWCRQPQILPLKSLEFIVKVEQSGYFECWIAVFYVDIASMW